MLGEGFAGKAVGTVATGVAGVVAVEAFKRWAGPRWAHRAAVQATTWGLRVTREAEVAAETARLYGADLVAEARERLGETAPPPGGGLGSDHGHEH